MEKPPWKTQDWINKFCYEMISKTVIRMIETTYNGFGKHCYPVWVPYHDGVDGNSSIAMYRGVIHSKDTTKEDLALSCNIRIYLLYSDSFSRWNENGTPREKPRNINVWFLINITPEDTNSFHKRFQDNIKVYNTKPRSGRPNCKPILNHKM